MFTGFPPDSVAPSPQAASPEKKTKMTAVKEKAASVKHAVSEQAHKNNQGVEGTVPPVLFLFFGGGS